MILLDVSEGIDLMVDTCTLNNAMNAVQIAILIALLNWVRRREL